MYYDVCRDRTTNLFRLFNAWNVHLKLIVYHEVEAYLLSTFFVYLHHYVVAFNVPTVRIRDTSTM